MNYFNRILSASRAIKLLIGSADVADESATVVISDSCLSKLKKSLIKDCGNGLINDQRYDNQPLNVYGVRWIGKSSVHEWQSEKVLTGFWDGTSLATRLRSFPAVPPGTDAFDVRTSCDLMEAAALEIERLQKHIIELEDAAADKMLEEAFEANYGSDT